MPSSVLVLLRWLVTASVIVLLVLIMLKSMRPAQAGDAALLVRAAPPTELAAGPSVAASSISAGASPTAAALIAVDVIGAVAHPGVYWLVPAQRVDDAVRAAGGLAADADRERINLAARIEDGQQIRILRVGEGDIAASVSDPSSSALNAAPDAAELIDINRADAAALDSLPGIGPATAAAIIDYRTNNGPFKQIEAIQDVKGIGPAVYAKIKDNITVEP